MPHDSRCQSLPIARKLQKALRVDVYRNAHRAADFRTGGEQGADVGLHVGAAFAMHEQAEAVATGDQRQRRLGRA